MTRAEWGATLLGAVAAMAWMAGPMPLPPAPQPAEPVDRERADRAAPAPRSRLRTPQVAPCAAGGTFAG